MKFQQIQVKHCYRQANRCADMLARMGMDQDLALCILILVRTLGPVLDEDYNGMFYNKLSTDLVVMALFFNELSVYQKKN